MGGSDVAHRSSAASHRGIIRLPCVVADSRSRRDHENQTVVAIMYCCSRPSSQGRWSLLSCVSVPWALWHQPSTGAGLANQPCHHSAAVGTRYIQTRHTVTAHTHPIVLAGMLRCTPPSREQGVFCLAVEYTHSACVGPGSIQEELDQASVYPGSY